MRVPLNMTLYILMAFLFSFCKKEGFINENQYKKPELTIYEPIDSFQRAFALKHIPGVGVVPWKANTMVTKFTALNQAQMQSTWNLLSIFTGIQTENQGFYDREKLYIYLPHHSLIKKGVKIKLISADYQYHKDFQVIFFGIEADGDVITRVYKLNPYYDNFILFTDIDTDNKILKGIFSVHLKMDRDIITSGDYNDNLFLEEGRFEATYSE